MEDYDVFNELHNKKLTVLIIEDDEKFIIEELLALSFLELIPVRYSYKLESFSSYYVELTKELFTYYYDVKNSFINQKLRLQKHFIHYMRRPKFAYVPDVDQYYELMDILRELNIEIFNDKKQFLKEIKEDDGNEQF